jgi:hypothetical protein
VVFFGYSDHEMSERDLRVVSIMLWYVGWSMTYPHCLAPERWGDPCGGRGMLAERHLSSVLVRAVEVEMTDPGVSNNSRFSHVREVGIYH